MIENQRDGSNIPSNSKYMVTVNTNTGESIIYSSDLKDDDFEENEIIPNNLSLINSNEIEYEEDFNGRNLENKNKKRPKSVNSQYYQPQITGQPVKSQSNRNLKKQQAYQQGHYYQQQQIEANDDFEYYPDENEEYNEEIEDENYSVQQPINRSNVHQKVSMNKALKSETHFTKPVLINSSSTNINNNNINNNQTRSTPGNAHHTQKSAQNYSSPTKHNNPNSSPNNKTNNNITMNHHAFGYEVGKKILK